MLQDYFYSQYRKPPAPCPATVLEQALASRFSTDNWFSSIPLFSYFKHKEIWATGVLQTNCTHHCPLFKEEELEMKGRGAHDSAIDEKN